MLDEQSYLNTQARIDHYAEGVSWDADLPARTLDDMFRESVDQYADQYMLDFLGRRWTYEAAGQEVERLTRGLRSLDIGPGDHVGLMLPNCPAYVFAFFAIQRLGAVVVNMNPMLAEKEVEAITSDSKIRLLITLDFKDFIDKCIPRLEDTDLEQIVYVRFASMLPKSKAMLFSFIRRKTLIGKPEDPRLIDFQDLMLDAGVVPPSPSEPGDIAVLQYTGGTTGIPKGAKLTHSNLMVNVYQIKLWDVGRPAEGQERVMAVLPFFHVFAMTCCLNMAVSNGNEIIMLPRFELKQLLRALHRTRPAHFPAVPTLLAAINNNPISKKYDLSAVRIVQCGGAPLPDEVRRRFETDHGCTVIEGYGLSETSPVATSNPVRGANVVGSAGLPLPRTHIDIVSVEDGKTLLGTNERGEIAIRGPQVMSGYWNKPEESAKALRNGRFHTGDIGYLDEAGYLFIVDRLKEVILAGGYNVYPRNVEEALYLHEGIAECAVIGVDDPYRGQTVRACIVLKPEQDVTEDELSDFLKDKLSPYEMPKQFDFRTDLPKSAVGKILKKELIAELAEKSKSQDD